MTTETTETRRPRRTPAGTIDLTPTWRAVLPLLIHVTREGPDSSRQIAREEAERMALAASRAAEPLAVDVGAVLDLLRDDRREVRDAAETALRSVADAADRYNATAERGVEP